MFVDTAKIHIKAGNGGNGLVSFHREKYVAAGGPDGGDGGRGGNVVFVADHTLSTLMDFRYKKKYAAQNGVDGGAAKCSGRHGEDIVIKVPLGTMIKDAQTGSLLADLTDNDQSYIAARGGNGGFGNQHFATPTRQVPRFAKPGLIGEEREVILELKLIADVGLLGFPNVGKSTLLSSVSEARPKIANYHFTTLEPNLGVVDLGDEGSFVLADIPGLIEGAHTGIGLGHEFLRHIERTRLLIHVVDVSGIEGRNPIEDFDTINAELQQYSPTLAKKIQIVAANKIDLGMNLELKEAFIKEMESRGLEVVEISAATQKGVRELMQKASQKLKLLPKEEVNIITPIDAKEHIEEEPFTIRVDDKTFIVEGGYIAHLVRSVNFEDSESMQFFQMSLKKKGVFDKLELMGINEGDTVKMYDLEFEYIR